MNKLHAFETTEELVIFCQNRTESSVLSKTKKGTERVVSTRQLLVTKGIEGMVERGVWIIDTTDLDWYVDNLDLLGVEEVATDFDFDLGDDLEVSTEPDVQMIKHIEHVKVQKKKWLFVIVMAITFIYAVLSLAINFPIVKSDFWTAMSTLLVTFIWFILFSSKNKQVED